MLKQIEHEIKTFIINSIKAKNILDIDYLQFGSLRFTLLKVDVGYKIEVRKTGQWRSNEELMVIRATWLRNRKLWKAIRYNKKSIQKNIEYQKHKNIVDCFPKERKNNFLRQVKLERIIDE